MKHYNAIVFNCIQHQLRGRLKPSRPVLDAPTKSI